MSDILIIEDNQGIADGIRVNLELEGYAVEIATDGHEGLARARLWRPRLIILDLMLPKLDGFQVLRRLRDEGLEMPVLILSARSGEPEKVRGFRIGADDYVTKPFGLAELLARVEALMRRRHREAVPAGRQAPAEVVRFGDVEVDLRGQQVRRGGADVSLRPKEFALLRALIQRRGAVASRSDLLKEVWGYHGGVMSRTVDSHIMTLRRKLESQPLKPAHILTVRKSGYVLRMGD